MKFFDLSCGQFHDVGIHELHISIDVSHYNISVNLKNIYLPPLKDRKQKQNDNT